MNNELRILLGENGAIPCDSPRFSKDDEIEVDLLNFLNTEELVDEFEKLIGDREYYFFLSSTWEADNMGDGITTPHEPGHYSPESIYLAIRQTRHKWTEFITELDPQKY